MKRDELQKCCICIEGVMKDRQLTFSRVTIERFVIDLNAVQRRAGLENFFGGGGFGASLAGIMGTDDDLATKLGEKTLFICDKCGVHQVDSIFGFNEREPQIV